MRRTLAGPVFELGWLLVRASWWLGGRRHRDHVSQRHPVPRQVTVHLKR